MALVKTTSTGKPVELNGLVEESFSLDLSSTDTLISLLANMYARPEFSSLRELLQNAKDAGPGHIDVTLPTEAEPTLIVRDFGKGMSESDMRDLIQKVGASDKRGDATQAGNLGIGSIAPMSIADTMTISSFKNGKMTVLTAWKNDAGDIRLSITPSVESSEPRGTKVCVPLHPELFGKLRAGLEVFRFSPAMAERIRVDGEPLRPFEASYRKTVKVGEHEVSFSLVDGSTEVLPGALVLMNGIPMGASLERFPELKDFASFLESHEAAMGRRSTYSGGKTTMVIDIPPEAGLSFPPSREVVAVTRLNAAFLSNACKRYFSAGIDELKAKGLHIGCESAVLSYWKMAAVDQKAKLREAMNSVAHELNKTSEYLRVVLGFTHWGGSEIPVVTLEPKIPADCDARSLSVEHYRPNRRSYDYKWRVQTCDLVPLDLEKPEMGDKYPYSPSATVTLIHSAKLGDGGWSSLLAQNLKAKQALFELATVRDKYAGLNTVPALVMSKPLPDDHPMASAPNAKKVDFDEFMESFAPRSDNPFLADEDDEEEMDDGDGPAKPKRPKQRHPRTFLTSAGERQQLGLPNAKPFLYLETLRDRFQDKNFAGLPAKASTWKEFDDYRSWMRFFERAGIGDGYDTVYLIPSEAKHIRREHVLLKDALAEDMQRYREGLDADELAWLPFSMFRATLNRKCPSVCAYFDALYKGFETAGAYPDEESKAFLRICSPAPTDRAALFSIAFAKEIKDGTTNPYGNRSRSNAEEQFDEILDRSPGSPPAKEVFGFPAKELEKPAEALKAWVAKKTQLAAWTRLFWAICHENGQMSKLGEAPWLGIPNRKIDGLITPAEAANIAKLLDPRP